MSLFARAGRRAEGHVEYIVITSLIMVCALVSFFSMINDIKDIAGRLKICADCDEEGIEKKKTSQPGDQGASKDEGSKDPAAGGAGPTASKPAGPPSWMPDWLASLFYWFSGSPWFWDSATYA